MPTFPVTIGTSATPVLPYNNRVTSAAFFNNSTETIYISNDETNIVADGWPIAVGASLSLIRALGDEPHLRWFGQSAGGNDNLRVLVAHGALPELTVPLSRAVTALEGA